MELNKENNELTQRMESFRTGLKKLSEDTQIEMIGVPYFIPNQQGSFSVSVIPQLIDRKDILSPTQKDDLIKE